MSRYAVNIADLQSWMIREGGFCGPLLLLRPVLTEEIVRCERERWDGDSLLVDESTDPARWAAIMEIIRDEWKLHPNSGLRIYESKTGNGSWKRI